MNSMKLKCLFLILLIGLIAEAAGPPSEFAAARACYAQGQFKQAVAHFQLALQANPADADSYYWMGMSYQTLADIAFPFTGKYASRARIYLTKATELAPGRLEYRKELFDFLLDSAGSSRSARRQAAGILQSVLPNDPEYESMRLQFEQESKANASTDARLGRALLAVPRAVYRIADLARPASSTRPEIASMKAGPE
jgi:tetratricopeptide (TPR) repeat protein